MKNLITIFTIALTLSLSLSFSNLYAVNFSGNYKIGTAGADYQAIAYAVLALKNGTINGDCIFEIQGDYNIANEAIPLTIPNFPNNPNNYKITFRPAANVSSLVVEGSTNSYNQGAAIINLDGAANIIFDGRPGGIGTNIVWIIRNINSGVTIGVYNDVNNIDFKYLNIQGKNAGNVSGQISIGNGKTDGNKQIIVENCLFLALPNNKICNGIYSNSISGVNREIIIRNNNFSSGTCIAVTKNGNGDNWLINNNNIYGDISGFVYKILIDFEASGTGNQIINNYLGGTLPNCQGEAMLSNTFIGIKIANGSVDLKNNHLNNIKVTGAFTGISASNTISDISKNYIQTINIQGTDTETFYGIFTQDGTIKLDSNVIGHPDIAKNINIIGCINAYFIYCHRSNGDINVKNNLLINIFLKYTAYDYYFNNTYGIRVSQFKGNVNITNNHIDNIENDNIFSGLGKTGYNSRFWGIVADSTSNSNLINKNIIEHIKTINGSISGIYTYSFTSINTVTDNTLYNFYFQNSTYITDKSAYSYLIYTAKGTSNFISNNYISKGWMYSNYEGLKLIYSTSPGIITNNILKNYGNYGGVTYLNGITVTSGNNEISDNIIDSLILKHKSLYAIQSSSPGECEILRNKISNLQIDNFTDGNTDFIIYGIKTGSGYNRIISNSLSDISITTDKTGKNGLTNTIHCIEFYNGLCSGNNIHNITFTPLLISYETYSCEIVGINKLPGSTDNNLNSISNNIIYHIDCHANFKSMKEYGIQVSFNSNTPSQNYVENNMIYDLMASVAVSEIIGINSIAGNANINNNILSIGLPSSYLANPATTKGINIASTSGSNNFNYNSIYLGDKVTEITSNTSYNLYIGCKNVQTLHNNILVNLFKKISNVSGNYYCIYIPDSTKLISDHNLFLTSGSANKCYIGYVNFTDCANLISWQTFTNKDINSIAVDPLFTNSAIYPPDFHLLNNSPAIGLGIPVAKVTTDYDRNTRSATATTAGAYEFIAPVTFKISGNVNYDNTAKSPIKNTYFILKNSESVKIDSVQTDASGYYEFNNITNGQYTLVPKMTIAWNGGNSTDALLINKYFVKLINITDPLLKKTADVNIDNSINATDGLLINKRFVKLTNSFKAGDWLWDDNAVTVNGLDVTKDIKMVCTGDVNASYAP